MTKVICVFLFFLLQSACTKYATRDMGRTLLEVQSSPDPLLRADGLARCVEISAKKFQPKIGSAKQQLIRSGGIATAIGVIGASYSSALDNDKDKANTALITAVIGAAIGAYQVWKGAERDATGYVQDSGKLVSKYEAEKLAAGNDQDKKTKAAVELFTGAGKLKDQYPEYANFELTGLVQCQ